MIMTSQKDKKLKEEEDQKIRELISDIEEKMKLLLKDEKFKLLDEVDKAVKKKKSFMPDSNE